MYPLSSPTDLTNSCLKICKESETKRQKLNTQLNYNVYFILGQPVWETVFCEIQHMSKQTANRFSTSVADEHINTKIFKAIFASFWNKIHTDSYMLAIRA